MNAVTRSAPTSSVAAGTAPETAVTRLVIGVLSLTGLAVGLLAALVDAEVLRALGLLLFCTLGIGSAPWQRDARIDLSTRLAYSVVTSLGVWTIPSVLMVATQVWHPLAVFAVVATITAPLHVLGIQRSLEAGAGVRVQGWLADAAADPRLRTALRHPPTWAVAAAGGLLCLIAAMTHRHIDPGFGGYLTQIGVVWYVGLALVLLSIARGRHSPEWALALSVVTLLLVLTLTPSLVYDGTRSQSAFKHVDLIEQIMTTGALDAVMDIYDVFPGFFTAVAWLSAAMGVDDPNLLAIFWPPLIGLLRLAVLRHLFGHLLAGSWQRWVAVTLAVLADSIGADYFSPQSVGFVLGIAAFGLALAPGAPAARQAVLFVAGCTVAMTHQLSPFVIAGVLVVLAVLRQVRPWHTCLLVLLPALGWVAANWSVISGFVSLDGLGSISNFRPPETDEMSGLDRMPIVTLSVVGLVTGILLVGAFALAALVRGRRDLRTWALACCPGVGLALVAANPYGQEAIFRAALFGIPWLAALAARWFSADSPRRSLLLPVLITLSATFLVSSSGLDGLTVTRPADVAAVRYAMAHGGDDYAIVSIGIGDLPFTLRPGLVRVGSWAVDVQSEEAVALPADARVQWLTQQLWDGYLLPTDRTREAVYALWSPSQSYYQAAYGLQRPESFAEFRDALERSPFWDVAFARDGTVMFQFDGARYAADAS